MRTFTILIVCALGLGAAACEAPATAGPSAWQPGAGSKADVEPPSTQPNPLAVVVGPNGLHAR